MKTEILLKIAEEIILMKSDFPHTRYENMGQRLQFAHRYSNFIYSGRQGPNIIIDINIVDRLPQFSGSKSMFITYHPQDHHENWRLLKKGDNYIYRVIFGEDRQVMVINKTFDRVSAYLMPKKESGRVWSMGNIIYDFLQVLLINYFSQRNKGIFVHSVGIKDINGDGLLFAGESGAGKSTTARLWHKYSRAKVLNDDRIIIRRIKGDFFICGSPWHGDFSDYLASKIESARLEKLFFIYHALENKLKRISAMAAFGLFYPALFPTFWSKECLENIVSFSEKLVKVVPCYNLGFVNNRKVINFVRKT